MFSKGLSATSRLKFLCFIITLVKDEYHLFFTYNKVSGMLSLLEKQFTQKIDLKYFLPFIMPCKNLQSNFHTLPLLIFTTGLMILLLVLHSLCDGVSGITCKLASGRYRIEPFAL